MRRRSAIIILLFLLGFQVFWHFNLTFLVQGNPRLAAWMVAEGAALYREFSLVYPPGMPYLVAWLESAVGDEIFAFRLVWLASHLGATAVVFVLARRLFSSWGAGVLAAAIMSLWIFLWGKNQFWYHAPIFLFAPLSLLLFAPFAETFPFIFAGVVLGVAFLFKQSAVWFVLAFVLVLVIHRKLSAVVLFVLGALFPTALVGFWWFLRGDFWWLWQDVVVRGIGVGTGAGATFGSYLDIPPPRILIQFGLYAFLFFFLKKRSLLQKRSAVEQFTWDLILAGAVAGSAFMIPRVFPGYALFALPFLSLMTVCILRQEPRRWGMLVVVFSITFLSMAGNFFPHFQNNNERERSLQPIVSWLREYTDPDERVFVCCTAPEVYIEAKRKPASRYVDWTERNVVALNLDARIREDLETNKPRIVVDLRDSHWERLKLVYFPKVLGYLEEHYRPVAEVAPGQFIYERTSTANNRIQ